MNLQELFKDVWMKTAAIRVDGAVLCAGKEAPVPGNHLFINCLYPARVLAGKTEKWIGYARQDVIVILQSVSKSPVCSDLVCVCVTFFVQEPECEPGWACRRYRYNVLVSSFKDSIAHWNEDSVISNAWSEFSISLGSPPQPLH
jgi:hypothetical protein